MIHFIYPSDQLGSLVLLKEINQSFKTSDKLIKKEVIQFTDEKDLIFAPDKFKAKIISIGESFDQDQKELFKIVSKKAYQPFSLDQQRPLLERTYSTNSIIHIDLRVIHPHLASAIEGHPNKEFNSIHWNDLTLQILELAHHPSFQHINHFHISGYCPDRDRNMAILFQKGIHSHHLNSTQETHLYITSLLNNLFEIFRGALCP
jgi:hypothetical protein